MDRIKVKLETLSNKEDFSTLDLARIAHCSEEIDNFEQKVRRDEVIATLKSHNINIPEKLRKYCPGDGNPPGDGGADNDDGPAAKRARPGQ